MLALLTKRDLSNLKRASGKKVYKKFRYVDPKVKHKNKLTRLSKIKPAFGKLIEKHRAINKLGIEV